MKSVSSPRIASPIESHRDDLIRLCHKFGVSRIDLFGSAACERFDAGASDFDFRVEFHPLAAGQHAKAYFGLKEELQMILGRPTDLVMSRAVTNPYFFQAIEPSRVTLHED